MDNLPQVNIIVPLFNEEETFPKLTIRLSELMKKSKLSITIILVDDGSKDNTPLLMEELSKNDSRFTSIFLSRNFGHQLALTAAFSVVNSTEAVFVIDGDLQDPPELLEEFYSYYENGYDVVYAIRRKRKESFFKKILYKTFYRFLKQISYIEIPLDSGDFSLISRRAIDNIVEMKEESRFIRGMRSWIGYNQIGVDYDRHERAAGDSKYPFSKLLKLAFNGIFNFSEAPIKFISILGLFTISLSLLYLFYAIFNLIIFNEVPQGFVGLLFTVTLFGGVQLLSIGILGEYIIRIFFQVKNRPLFIIKKQISERETK